MNRFSRLCLAYLCLVSTACSTLPADALPATPYLTSTPRPGATALPTRAPYNPGELVDYIAQDGDTLPALAAHFNTSVEEIREANPIIPDDATTLPPGMPMKMPIYFLPLWGTPFKIIPDHAFVFGPTQDGFDTQAFVASHPGWLKDYREYAGGENRSGAQIVDYVALNFSLSPRLLLALLEYQAGALSRPGVADTTYPLGYTDRFHEGVYLQLVWAANILNNGYYGWRSGSLTEFELPDGLLERPDPWQNAATVGLQYYFSRLNAGSFYTRAIGPDGLLQTYQSLFGDPWTETLVLIPGSLQQPPMRMPFQPGELWTYTGGPHTGWGDGEPYAGIDFAPPSESSGCTPTTHPATAVADGLVIRTDVGIVVLDLDGDGLEQTGWVIFYLHVGTIGKARVGTWLKAGDPIGMPSCEGGHTTGTHIHLARKYNGEWMLAEGPLAFNLEGWVSHNGSQPYLGTLTRGGETVTACSCSDQASQVGSGDFLINP
jgi:murein DD-endopeptidase MepM/ murein hydrolase activator NlpD